MVRSIPAYVELHAHSSHSLLDGVSSPRDLVARAAAYGMPALALTDHDNLYAAVPFVRAAEEAGIKPLLGAEMTLADDTHLTLLAESALGYANLSQLITLAHAGQPKGKARLDPQLLKGYHTGLIALSGCRQGVVTRPLLQGDREQALAWATYYRDLFGPHNFFIELQRHYHPGEKRLIQTLKALADHLGLATVATANVHYLERAQREVHDVLTCLRLHTTLDQAGDQLRPNDEYYLRSPAAMARLFADTPEAILTTARIAARCASATTFLPHGHQIMPRFEVPDGSSPAHYLQRLCEQALSERYPLHPPKDLLRKELRIIRQLELSNYFLIVSDIMHYARTQGIRCQGRGSAANSLVAYLLGISPIDPIAHDLVFERFLSLERPRPPDIDIDFAADRREEVIQYVYRRYGRDHAAMACTLVTFRTRSATRDIARALGFPPPLVERLAVTLDVEDAQSIKEAERLVAASNADSGRTPLQHLLRLLPQLEGIPRHLGIHNGGMVLSGPPLSTLMPVEPATMPDRTVVQWDKEALEDAGIVKVDLLGLRMLSVIEDAVTIIAGLTGSRPNLESLDFGDPEVYDMLCRGETIGVFQVESRAQANLIPNFKPRCLADLAIEIALIRPGPLQANMVHPYLRRRQGVEPVHYAHPLLRPALSETLGVLVFQEQVLKIAHNVAGFTHGEGEQLRRALGRKDAAEAIEAFHKRFVAGAQSHGVMLATAERIFAQLKAFGGYAFAKSHAVAFAVLTYQSAWLRRYYPTAFFAALLRHQPMGFYPAHVIVSEARRHGVVIRPIDVHSSDRVATVEPTSQSAPYGAIRLGLDMLRDVGDKAIEGLLNARESGLFTSLQDLVRRTGLGRRALEALTMSGALDSWHKPRRQLLWELQAALSAAKAPPALDLPPEDEPTFGAFPPPQRVWLEQQYTGTTSRDHITTLIARQLRQMGTTPSSELPRWPNGTRVRIGGVVVARQRPPTAHGTVFLAVEDAAGIVNVVFRPETATAYHEALVQRFVLIEGKIQRDGAAVNVVGERIIALLPDP